MIVIGTRGSALAMTQSRAIAAALAEHGYAARLERILTQGDKVTHLSLQKLEGKGFFTKEIEQALFAGHIDVAVHCLKDLPGEPAPGLDVVAIPPREDPSDALIIRRDAYDPAAPIWPVRRGARVGTSAVRRKAQLAQHRPDLQAVDLRGNVPTRLAKLEPSADGPGFDAVVLAQAGLRRLGLDLSAHVHHVMDPTVFVPAPGQGALALQCRTDDDATRVALMMLHDPATAALVEAERGLLTLLEAGCHVPLGAHATRRGAQVHLGVYFGGDDARPGLRGPCRLDVLAPDAATAAERAFASLLKAPIAAAWSPAPAPLPSKRTPRLAPPS